MKKLLLTGILLMSILAALTGCGGRTPRTSFSIGESLVPGAASFPTKVDDSAQCTTVNYPYYMAKNEVTYALWKQVYDWAINNGYTFANPGNRGGGLSVVGTTSTLVYFDTGHESDPVTYISWYDAIVWCNALTEYYNAKNGKTLGCVYKYSTTGNVIKDSMNAASKTDLDGMKVFDSSANGFRLPTSMEWELAARYKDGSTWTPGNYASGATGPYTDAVATQAVGWYWDNSKVSSNPDIYSTQPVGHRPANGNALGLYDMSGNVWEWCFDLDPGSATPTRVYRGGGWSGEAFDLRVGYERYYAPGTVSLSFGFRPVRIKE